MRSFLCCQKGHILLQTLIIMPILLAMLFLPFNFSVLQHKRSVLDDILDKALQRAAVEGGLTADVRQEILNDLEARGFDPLTAEIGPAVHSARRRGEIIEISIAVPGNAHSLKGVMAIGGAPPPAEWMLKASGSIMSEKLP
ncbi:MAG: hypothetical protein RBT41_10355 [Clostridia bacterium]|jgi:hypothetical protein|nr:hypothetical protein [Clostridia bacterium]